MRLEAMGGGGEGGSNGGGGLGGTNGGGGWNGDGGGSAGPCTLALTCVCIHHVNTAMPTVSRSRTQQQLAVKYPGAAGPAQQPSRHRCHDALSTGKGLVSTREIHFCHLALLGGYGLRLWQHAYHQDHHSSVPTNAGSRPSIPSAGWLS